MANQDVSILRELAKQVAEIAALPVQEETRRLWRKLNARCPERPMVNIDQICWNEMNFDGSLTLQCEDPLLRSYEEELRQRLFIWKYLPVDRVVEPFVEVPKLIGGLEHGLRGPDLGVDVKEDLAFNGDATSEVTSHAYINQFKEEGDIGKIKTPKLSYDREQTEYNLARVQEVFDGILDVNLVGFRPNYRVWDILTNLMGVEPVMYDLMDRPEFIHALVQRMLDAHLEILDQLEEQDLLASYQTEIHCTGSYADDLPAPGTENPHPRAKDMWTFGLAQLFSSVSGAMHDEFDLAYGKRWYERFGAVYYGCCDPLDRKLDYVRQIPNLRKISMSPWVDVDRGAAGIGPDFVFSRKPNPAFLANSSWSADDVRRDLQHTYDACKSNGCPLEFILKDISTVLYRPDHLIEWAKICMEVARQ